MMKNSNKRQVILCWSAGKDSTATGIIAKTLGVHIDRIVTVMPDPFKQELILLEKFEKFMGIKVEMVKGPSFEDFFFRKKVRGKYKGTIYGWPFTRYKSCARIMKWDPMDEHVKGLDVQFLLGIAANETNRTVLEPNRSLLKDFRLTEDDARGICEEFGLLNPLYEHFNRLGCVRCPKQSRKALEKVASLEPKKYQWMLDHDDISPVKFKPPQKKGAPSISFKDYMGPEIY